MSAPSAVSTATDTTPVKPEKTDRRHPLVVTVDRLADHQSVYGDHITPAEQRQLHQLAELVDRIHRRVTGGDPS